MCSMNKLTHKTLLTDTDDNGCNFSFVSSFFSSISSTMKKLKSIFFPFLVYLKKRRTYTFFFVYTSLEFIYCLMFLNFGRKFFLLAGGESNPGPVFSTLRNAAVNSAHRAANSTFNFLFPQYEQWYSKVSEIATNCKNYSIVFLQFIRIYTSMVDCISTFLYRLAAITSLDLYSRLTVFCLNVFDVCNVMSKQLGVTVSWTTNPIAYPQAGPMETFCLATLLSTLLPPRLHSLIKDIPTFTNFKLLDDATWVFDFFSFIVSLPNKICSLLLPRSEKTEPVFAFLRIIEDFLPFSSLSKFHFLIKEILDEYAGKPSIVGDKAFQDRVERLYVKYIKYKNIFLEDRKELPPYMLDHDKRFRNLITKVRYMKSNIRVEPVACVFSGLRGTGKTTLMNIIVDGFSTQNSVYCHASQEDKDYHDQYDNEDIYVIDDIGQKGVWQWSNIINFVSTTKCPLLCADAPLKGTKFMTSKLIFATTNNINPTLTANCGITDIGALQRRLINFCFDKVTFFEGKYCGVIEVFKFDLVRSRWQLVHSFSSINNFFDVHDIANFIKNELSEKITNSKIFSEKRDFGAIPQSLFTEVKILPSKVKQYFLNFFQNFDDLVFPTVNDLALGTIFTLFGSIFVYGIYKCFDMFFEKVDDIPKLSKNLHFTSARKQKISLRSATPQSLDSLFFCDKSTVLIPQLQRIASQTVVIQADFLNFQNVNCSTYFCSVIAGRYFTAPLHSLNLGVGAKVFITVYTGPRTIFYDKIECTIDYVNDKDDIAILVLPLFLPKYFKNVSFIDDTNVTELALVTPAGIQLLNTHITELDCRISYKQFETGYNGVLSSDNSVVYQEQSDGVCGSFLVSKDGYLLGHHVAMVIGDNNHGCAKLFSNRTLNYIKKVFSENIDFVVATAQRDVEGSIVRKDAKVYHHVANNTKYVPSLVNGIFPEERKPANLSAFGSDTIKVMSEKSRKPVSTLDNKGIAYATTYMDSLLLDSTVLQSSLEVVLGNDSIGRIDPTSSVGYGLTGSKKDFLNYETGEISDIVKEQIVTFSNSIVDGSYSFDTYYQETLKDELKDVEKINKPRAFKAGPLILTILYRYLFGNLIGETLERRLVNGIMIGVNPLSKEWDTFARTLSRFSSHFFDGDWKFWDGGMLTQMQQRACAIIKSKVFKSSDYIIFNSLFSTSLDAYGYERVVDMLLVLLYNTPTITLNEAFITTHSMPSGCAITAFFNSLINKSYGAYVFYRLHLLKFKCEPPLNLYREKVFDCVYGDDKLTGVKHDVLDWFNGQEFSKIAQEMGLDFTPADKGEWTYTTRSLFECSFLKRGFRFHPRLGGVVAPLEEKSMCGTLNFVSDCFRNDELTCVKIKNFQREAFLHYTRYDQYMVHVKDFIKQKHIDVELLSESYLRQLYVADEYGDNLDFH